MYVLHNVMRVAVKEACCFVSLVTFCLQMLKSVHKTAKRSKTILGELQHLKVKVKLKNETFVCMYVCMYVCMHASNPNTCATLCHVLYYCHSL